jgi:hypothetical protein
MMTNLNKLKMYNTEHLAAVHDFVLLPLPRSLTGILVVGLVVKSAHSVFMAAT